MKQAVRDAFIGFSTKLEGCIPHLYADILGYVTTGIGNLVDPMHTAMGLPFVHPDGSDATPEEIVRAWTAVKSDPRCARLGYRYAATVPGNEIRLTPAGIQQLVFAKLDSNDAMLSHRYADWETFPADAHLAIHSLSWACGAAYRFPALDASMRARDFDDAAVHIKMNDAGNAGLIPRNLANRIMMHNAAIVEAGERELDPEVLYWPEDLSVTPPDAA